MGEIYGLREYFEIAWKQKKIIIAATMIAISISAVFSFFVLEPEYEAGTSILVNRIENETERYLDFDDVVLNQKLVNTYGRIAMSDAVLEKTMNDLNIVMDAEEFAKMISINIVENTEIMEIHVLSANPTEAARIANTMAAAFVDEVKRIMGMENIKIIDRAETPQSPSKPDKKVIIIVNGFIGMMVGLYAAFIKEYFDDTIKTPEDIEKEIGVPIIGVIPAYEGAKHRAKGRGNRL